MGVSALELRRRVLMAQPHKERKTGGIVSFNTHVPQVLGVAVPLSPVQAGTGDPYPPGGGVNLFDISTCHPGGAYGLTGEKNNETGEIRLHGTWTGSAIAAFRIIQDTDFPLTENAVYTAFDKNSDAEQHVTKLRAVSTTIGGMVVQVGGMTNGNSYDIVFKPCVSIGTAPTEYAPYSNIRPITGWTGATAYRTGKNLLPNKKYQYTATQVRLGGENSTEAYKKLKAGTYTLSVTGNVNVQCYYTHNSVNTLLGSNGGTLIVTEADEDKPYCFYCYKSGSLSADDVLTWQLEKGSTATPYAPYSGESYPFTFPETVYGCRIDWGRRVAVVEYAIKSVRDFGTWYAFEAGGFKGLRTRYTPLNANKSALMCSHYQAAVQSTLNPGKIVAGSWYYNLALCDPDHFITQAELFAYADAQAQAGQPIQIGVPLAEPVEIPLSTAEIRALMGENNVFSDAGDVDVEFWTN